MHINHVKAIFINLVKAGYSGYNTATYDAFFFILSDKLIGRYFRRALQKLRISHGSDEISSPIIFTWSIYSKT